MTLYEFSRQISDLKKQQNYAQVLQFFKENKHHFNSEEIINNKWLISDIITSLRKTNQSRFIDKFLQDFNIQINETLDELILNAYGWCLYDNVKNRIYNKYQIIQILQYPLFLLSKISTNFSYMIISNILREGLKIAKEHQNQDFKFTNDFCNLFDKNILSLECNSFEIKGKMTEQASDKEKWYSEKSKALFELKNFQECYDISNEVLEVIDNFHYSNDLWFARRIALSKKELVGNINEVIDNLKLIYKKKKDWFIQKEIAELYFEINDIDNAFKNAISAINNKGKLEFKIGLMFLIGKILKIKNELDLSYQYFLLVKKIREENQWRLPDELINEIDNLKINKEYETEQLIEKLKNYWTSFLPKKEIKQGKIIRILHDNERGKNGFISCENQEHYFAIPTHINFIDKIEENIKVGFEIIKLQDGRERAKILNIME